MRRTRLRKIQSQKRLIIISMLFIFSILTVGYAAFSTTLTLTAKGNVIKDVTPSELKELAGTSCNGELIEDPNEPGRYIYRGADPCNYLTINNETWRIMSIESDNTLKVIKTDSISKIWDSGYSSNITVTGATKTTSTIAGTRFQGLSSNTTNYCVSTNTTSTGSGYYGCKVWGSADTMRDSNGTLLKDTAGGAKMPKTVGEATTYNLPADEAYINYYLNNEYYNSLSYKELIETHSFDLGVVTSISEQDLATDISQAHAYTWQGKIGLMTVIDYVKANTNTSLCGTVNLSANSSNAATCKTTNWLFNSANLWTMSPASSLRSVWYVYSAGLLSDSSASNAYGVRPVLYLADCVQLRGSGTSGNHYTIKNADTCSAGQNQGSGSGGGSSSSNTTTVYAWNTTAITVGTSTINDLASTKTAQPYYTSAADVMNASGYPFFNKYTVVNNTITEGYTCQTFGISGFEPVCLKMSTDGSEYGYDAGGNHTGNAGILKMLQSNSTFTDNYSYCAFNLNYSGCRVDPLEADAFPDGRVTTENELAAAICNILNSGRAYCSDED